MPKPRAAGRSLVLIVLTLAALIALPAPVAADEPPPTEAERVIQIAKNQRGDRWKWLGNGPNEFDCSGLVFFAFKQAGLLDRVGGKRKSTRGFFGYFSNQGLANKVNPQPGDLIVWGNNTHIGIYIGNGMAVSTLINPHGVSIHPVTGYIGMKVKAYLHVDLERP